jgi:hypothetical protein
MFLHFKILKSHHIPFNHFQGFGVKENANMQPILFYMLFKKTNFFSTFEQ